MDVNDELTSLTDKGILLSVDKPTALLDSDIEDRLRRGLAAAAAAGPRVQVDYLKVNVVPSNEDNLPDLRLTWFVKEYTSQQMQIQIEFEKPLFVSNPDNDEIEIRFESDDVFYDKNGQSLTANSKVLLKNIPRQFPDQATAAAFEKAAEVADNASTAFLAGNVFLNIVLSASFQYLWDMINAQQLVILLPLFKVATPTNASMIFNFLMQIAAFELLPTDVFYSYFFGEDIEAEALNERFELIGLEHWLLMNNLGTFGFILLASSFVYAFYYVILACKCYKCCRRARKRLEPKLFWGLLLRMIIEGYIITLICCLLNSVKLDFSAESRFILTNSIVSVVSLPLLLLFPIVAICFMLGNFDQLKQPYTERRFGELYAAYSLERKTVLVHWGIEYARKITLALIVVFV